MAIGGEVFGKTFIGVRGAIELGSIFKRNNSCKGYNVDVNVIGF